MRVLRFTIVGALIPALLFTFIFAGCRGKKESDLEDAVSRYNRLLPIAFESSDANRMSDIVSPVELHRIEGFIEYQAQQGKSIRAKLEKIEFTESGKPKDKNKDGLEKGYVKTREWWLYKYENKQKPANPVKVFYEVRYELIKADKKWYVDRLVIDRQEVPLTGKYNGKYLSFSYPDNLSSISPESLGFRTVDSLEFTALSDGSQKDPSLVVVVKENKEAVKPDYTRLAEEIKRDYGQLYPGSKVVQTKTEKISGREWLRVDIELASPSGGDAEAPTAKKTQYAHIGSRVYWLTFALVNDFSHSSEPDKPLIESIMKSVILK